MIVHKCCVFFTNKTYSINTNSPRVHVLNIAAIVVWFVKIDFLEANS